MDEVTNRFRFFLQQSRWILFFLYLVFHSHLTHCKFLPNLPTNRGCFARGVMKSEERRKKTWPTSPYNIGAFTELKAFTNVMPSLEYE